jgi:hypothetical protein
VAVRINSISKDIGTVSYQKLAEMAARSEALSKPPKALTADSGQIAT